MSRTTLHMVPERVWTAHPATTPFRPAAYAADGFVHCTDGDAAMVDVANAFYRGDPASFLVLTVDLDAVGSPWRFDDPERRYPHVYGPISPGAVVGLRRMVRDARRDVHRDRAAAGGVTGDGPAAPLRRARPRPVRRRE